MQLDLGLAAMRHRAGRTAFRRQDEEIDPGQYEVEPLQGDRQAKAFIREHHYSGSFPASICNVGLFRHAPLRAPALVGVATFSVPVQPKAAKRYGAEGTTFCDLGRLVLLDDVPGNGETFFLRRAFAALARLKTREDGRPAYDMCLAYSDPVPRMDAAGRLRFRGHYGSIYQSANATYLGRATRKTMVIARDGTSIDARTMSKLRNDETGAAGAYKQLRRLGAPAIDAGEDGRSYLARAISQGPFRRVSHPGNHAYAFACGTRTRRLALHAKLSPADRTPIPFPKRTDAPIGWT